MVKYERKDGTKMKSFAVFISEEEHQKAEDNFINLPEFCRKSVREKLKEI